MKKSEQKVSITINLSPEDAWEVIGAVSGVDKWLAPIQACHVEGDKRYCTVEQGEFEEDILKVDNEKMELHYAIPEQPIAPVKNIIGLMKVSPARDSQSLIEWGWTFDVEEADEDSAKEMLAGMGKMGIEGIESLILSRVS